MPRLGRRARPARLTWINSLTAFPQSLAAGVNTFVDLCASAEAFQKFDSTIVKVLGSINFTWLQLDVGVSTLDCSVMAYMYVADEAIPQASMPDIEDPSVQPAYLWTFARSHRLRRVTDGALVDTADDSVNWWERLDIGAQRRFRENNKTLYLRVQNTSTNATLLWGAYIRTLVRIP